MGYIKTKDNHTKDVSQADIDDLIKIANIQLDKNLPDKHPNLLIFPPKWNYYKDDIKSKICVLEPKGADEWVLHTNNIMGFVGMNDTKLTISSRFADDNGNYFLHYMLQKVLCFNLFDLKHTSDEEQSLDFLIYLFPHYLLCAYQQGIFKQYIRKQYNDDKIKGAIDVPRHIKLNQFFNGKVAYSTREMCYDNHITQLVRHTIEYIKVKDPNVLRNREVTEAVNAFVYATPSYNRQQRERVIEKNLRPFNHPYFTAYSQLRQLCLAILRHNKMHYGAKNDEIYGILFDGSWLWEEYLNTILKERGFKHPNNRARTDGKSIFRGGKGVCYPDFYKDNEVVLDAKYKLNKDEKIERTDLYQIISYLHVLSAKKSGVIHPIQDGETECTHEGVLNGMGGDIFSISFKIPQSATSMNDFREQIYKSECALKYIEI